jgi:hypothetical protein
MSQTPAGWYDDGQGAQRWWDGTRWTEHTQPGPGSSADRPAADGGSNPHTDVTRVGGPPPSDPSPGPDRPAGGDQPPPSADVTMVAPQGLHQPPAGQPGHPSQPGQPYQQGGYQQPQYGQPGQPGQPGVPAWQQQPYGGGTSSGGGKGKLIAILGGGGLVVVIVVVLLFALLGGGGPKGAVEDTFDAIQDGDCGYIEHLSNTALGTTESNRDDVIDEAKKSCEDQNEDDDAGDGCDVEIDNEDVVEEDERVTYDYTVTGCDDESQNQEATEVTVVKEDGEWRVESF